MDKAYKKVDFQQAKSLMDADKPALLLDVRTEDEYIVEHAAGAVLLPLDDINEQSAAAAAPDKNAPVLIYCRTGRRSRLAAQALEALGYTDINDVGSLEGWPYGKEYGI